MFTKTGASSAASGPRKEKAAANKSEPTSVARSTAPHRPSIHQPLPAGRRWGETSRSSVNLRVQSWMSGTEAESQRFRAPHRLLHYRPARSRNRRRSTTQSGHLGLTEPRVRFWRRSRRCRRSVRLRLPPWLLPAKHGRRLLQYAAKRLHRSRPVLGLSNSMLRFYPSSR